VTFGATQVCIVLPHENKVLFLAPSVTFCLFVCASNISGTAEWIYAKFTGKTCFVPRSDLDVKVKSQGYQGQKLENCYVIPIDNAL